MTFQFTILSMNKVINMIKYYNILQSFSLNELNINLLKSEEAHLLFKAAFLIRHDRHVSQDPLVWGTQLFEIPKALVSLKAGLLEVELDWFQIFKKMFIHILTFNVLFYILVYSY